MDRIEFIKKASKYFNTPLDENYDGQMHFDIKGSAAEELLELNKNTDRRGNSKEKEIFLINNSNIKSFLEENNLPLDIDKLKGNIYIKSRQDFYALEDYNEISFNVIFNINQIYDSLSFNYLESDYVDIYRLENEEGIGVYKAGLRVKSEKPKINPAPDVDGDIKFVFTYKRSVQEGYESGYRSKWFFGFQNKEKILDWFHEEEDIKDFINNDIKLSHYRVPKKYAIESDTQIVFKKDKSIKIKSVTLKEHFDSLKMKEFLESKEIKKEGKKVKYGR